MNNERSQKISSGSLSYFPRYFTSRSIVAYFLILIACSLVFIGNILPFIWILWGAIPVYAFFHFSNNLSRRWADISDANFSKKIFIWALVIRVACVVVLYYFFQSMTGDPFEFAAADSKGYWAEAIWLTDLFHDGRLSHYFQSYVTGYSDIGFPLYLFAVRLLLGGAIIIPRLLNALLGAWMCVLIYKMAKRNFGVGAARIAALLAMLLPNFIYYAGLHLKETLMVFLVVAFLERTDYLFRTTMKFSLNFFLVVALGSSLFLFRTVLAVSAWFAFFSVMLLSEKRKSAFFNRLLIGIWLVFIVLLVFPERVARELEQYAELSKTSQEKQMVHFSEREGGNKLAKYGKAWMFLPSIIIAPMPTLVDTYQENVMMTNGLMFTKNIYAFFIIICLILIYKHKLWRKYILIISFLLSYLFILSYSGFALSERLHLPALPALLMLTGYGISKMNNKYSKFFVIYLVLIGIVIVGWNWFKLTGRALF